jgi:hypothetical protein
VGMRDVGLELKGVLEAISNPFKHFSRIGGFAGRKLEAMFRSPEVHIRSGELASDAEQLGHTVNLFGSNVERLLRTYREDVVDRQYQLGRIADAAIELYVSGCVIRRMDWLLQQGHNGHHELDSKRLSQNLLSGSYYLRTAQRRIRRALADLWDNDDPFTTEVADSLLAKHK